MASEYLKQELAEKNILVNCYFPGVVDTEMQKTLRNSKSEVFPFAEEFKKLKKENRLSSPKIVAAHIMNIFLNSSDLEFSNQYWKFEN